MITIAVANQKGGVGKTTTAVNLIDGLKQRGFRVLGVELDPQRNMSFAFGVNDDEQECAFVDVLQGNAAFENVVKHTERCDIWPADNSLVAWRAGKLEIDMIALKNILASHRDEYDYIVLDTAPDKSYVNLSALIAADKLVLVVQADMFSVFALRDFYAFYKKVVYPINDSLIIDGILVTRFSGRTNIAKRAWEIFQNAAKAFKTRVYELPIREAVAVKMALAEQKSLRQYAPNTLALQDYEAFVDAVLNV